jgi:hypothetical protein
LSRFLVVSYRYDDDTVGEIFDSISHREYMGLTRIKLVFPDNQEVVDIPPEIAEQAKAFVIEHTERLRKSGRGYGFRELKNMLRLLCANVLLENAQNGEQRAVVNADDLAEVERLSYLINEEFNAIKEASKS